MFDRPRPTSVRGRTDTFSSDDTVVDFHMEPLPTSKGSIAIVKVERDIQQITVEGYRTLGIVSTFIAGVEAQCLGIVSSVSRYPKVIEVASSLLVIGVLLSSFGAALSLLSARWFDLLKDGEIQLLEQRWEEARQEYNRRKGSQLEVFDKSQRPNEVDKDKSQGDWKNYLVAKAVASTLYIVFSGFATFVVGMTLYTWAAYSLTTAIANTIVAVMGTLLIIGMHLDFTFMGALQYMSFKRIRI